MLHLRAEEVEVFTCPLPSVRRPLTFRPALWGLNILLQLQVKRKMFDQEAGGFTNSECRGNMGGASTASATARITPLHGVLSCGFLNFKEMTWYWTLFCNLLLFLNSKLYTWDLSILKYVDINNLFNSSMVFKYLNISVYSSIPLLIVCFHFTPFWWQCYIIRWSHTGWALWLNLFDLSITEGNMPQSCTTIVDLLISSCNLLVLFIYKGGCIII